MPPKVAKTHYDIYGFHGCGFADRAADLAKAQPNGKVAIHMVDYDKWALSIDKLKKRVHAKNPRIGQRFMDWRSSPIVFVNGVFVGGCDDFTAYIKSKA